LNSAPYNKTPHEISFIVGSTRGQVIQSLRSKGLHA
jgi:hypothetical protein